MGRIELIPGAIKGKFRIDLISGLLTGIFIGLAMPFAGIEARRLGASPAWVAVIPMAFPAGSLVSLYVSDKIKLAQAARSAALVSGLGRALLLLTPLFGYLVPDGRGLVMAFFLSTFVMCLAGPAYTGAMGRVYPNRCRAKMMGYVRVGVAAASVAGAALGGFLLRNSALDVHYYYIIPAVFGVLGSLVFSLIERPGTGDQNEPIKPESRFSVQRFLVILRNNKPFRNFLFFSFLCGFGNLMLISIAPVFWKDWLSLTSVDISIFSSVSLSVSLVSFIWIGRIIDESRPMLIMARFQALLIFIPAIYILAAILRSPYPLLLAFILGGVLNASIELAVFKTVLSLARGGNMARYQGLWAAAFGLRGLIAPVVAVALLNLSGGEQKLASYITVFCVGFIVTIVGVLMNLRLVKRTGRMEDRILKRG